MPSWRFVRSASAGAFKLVELELGHLERIQVVEASALANGRVRLQHGDLFVHAGHAGGLDHCVAHPTQESHACLGSAVGGRPAPDQRDGGSFYWLIDPELRAVEALTLRDGAWVELGVFDETATTRIEPFDAIELEIGRLFLPKEADEL
jgi:hypothetical protein